jgi:hypothetical protein
MKYSKLSVAGVAALALGGCISYPPAWEGPQRTESTGPVGYDDTAGSGHAGMVADTKSKGNMESASK